MTMMVISSKPTINSLNMTTTPFPFPGRAERTPVADGILGHLSPCPSTAFQWFSWAFANVRIQVPYSVKTGNSFPLPCLLPQGPITDEARREPQRLTTHGLNASRLSKVCRLSFDPSSLFFLLVVSLSPVPAFVPQARDPQGRRTSRRPPITRLLARRHSSRRRTQSHLHSVAVRPGNT